MKFSSKEFNRRAKNDTKQTAYKKPDPYKIIAEKTVKVYILEYFTGVDWVPQYGFGPFVNKKEASEAFVKRGCIDRPSLYRIMVYVPRLKMKGEQTSSGTSVVKLDGQLFGRALHSPLIKRIVGKF